MKQRPVVWTVKPHWLKTGPNESRKVKMRESENPDSSDRHRTTGSLTNMTNCARARRREGLRQYGRETRGER